MAIEETVEYKGKSLLVLGAGGHGKVVAEIATDLGFVKIDFLDDNSPEAIGSVQDQGSGRRESTGGPCSRP